MRRMFSEEQLKKIVKDFLASNEDFDFGGNVYIDGDLSVAGSINGEENPSVKPIYCHPININVGVTGQKGARLTCLIFNNDETPFTIETFEAWLKDKVSVDNPLVRIMMSGAFYNSLSSSTIIVSFLGYSNDPAVKFYFSGLFTNGDNASISGGETISELIGTLLSFSDGVNKIN